MVHRVHLPSVHKRLRKNRGLALVVVVLLSSILLAACSTAADEPGGDEEADVLSGNRQNGTAGDGEPLAHGEENGGDSDGSARQKGVRPVKIGLVLSITGHAAVPGESARNAVDLMRSDFDTLGDHPVEWIVYDDASDRVKALAAVGQLILQDGAAAVVCCSTTHNTMAALPLAAEHEVPLLALSNINGLAQQLHGTEGEGADKDTEPQTWVYQIPPADAVMIDTLLDFMVEKEHKKIAYIGSNDEFDLPAWLAFERGAKERKLEITAMEKFKRTATDLTKPLTKIAETSPDALVVWAAPPVSNVAQRNIKELGLGVPIYQSHDAADARLLELEDDLLWGTSLPAGKLLAAAELPDEDPQKEILVAFRERYENRFGAGSINSFSGYAHDAMLLIMSAMEKAVDDGADPGNPLPFRAALRQALAGTEDVAGVSGIYNFKANGPQGLDGGSAIMLTIGQGRWQLAQ